MKIPFRLLSLLAGLFLTGCANKALVHSYQGDVYVQTLQVELAPIRDTEQNLSGEYSDVTKILKGVQEIKELFDARQSEVLVQQLHTFETSLVNGIRERSGVPIKLEEESEVSMSYGDQFELTNIEFDYPIKDGAYVNLFATIYYTERSDLAVGMEEYNANFIELRPEIILQIDGYTEKGDLFWRNTSRYESNEMFRFGDQYVFGVPLDRLEESQIFLVPMAKGAIENLEILE